MLLGHGLFLIHLTLSHTEQKFFILLRSGLLMISLMDHAFRAVSKRSLSNPEAARLSPLFFLRSLRVSHFTIGLALVLAWLSPEAPGWEVWSSEWW